MTETTCDCCGFVNPVGGLTAHDFKHPLIVGSPNTTGHFCQICLNTHFHKAVTEFAQDAGMCASIGWIANCIRADIAKRSE